MNEMKQEILSLDDIYFKDAFTKTEDKLNLQVNNADIDCMTSRNNKFSLDSEGNLIVQSITTENLNAQNILDMIYPAGSIYITINNENPSTLFGGVWEQIKDTFLLGAGEKYSAGTSGGEDTHKLTVAEMPEHNHSATRHRGSGNMTWGGLIGVDKVDGVSKGVQYTGPTGGNQPHNNMPPFLTVYIWKRLS